jgi:hypothetical protein
VLHLLPSDAGALVKEILAQLDEPGRQHVLIWEQQALQLLPMLEAYREQLILQIGHDDWQRETILEEESGMDSVDAKWGAGRGWRLFCVTDLILACKTCLVEHQPICIAFD